MIISGGSRKNWRYFARHLLNATENEQVEVLELPEGASTVYEALRDWSVVASGERTENFFYHADLNPRREEFLTRDQAMQAVDLAADTLGLQEQPRLVVAHIKEGRLHFHAVWLRIDPDTGKAVRDSHNYRKHAEASRRIEATLGLEPVAPILAQERSGPRPERRPKNWEMFRGAESGLDVAQAKADLQAAWASSRTGMEMATELRRRGYILCKGDRRDFCVIDPAGDEHSLGRRLPGVKAAELRERMRDVDRPALPSVAEGRALANAWGEDGEAAAKVRRRELVQDMKRLAGEMGLKKTLPVPMPPSGRRSPEADGETRRILARIRAVEKTRRRMSRPPSADQEEEYRIVLTEKGRRARLPPPEPETPSPSSWQARLLRERGKGERGKGG